MYNSLVERCFKDCIDSFRRKELDSTEEKARCPLPLLFRCSSTFWLYVLLVARQVADACHFAGAVHTTMFRKVYEKFSKNRS